MDNVGQLPWNGRRIVALDSRNVWAPDDGVGDNSIDAAYWKNRRCAPEKGYQMRYKAVFIAGVAVGFMAGSRAGRGAYDRIISSGRKIAGHPKVQQATSTVQAKAADLTKTAAAKAPDYAKSAATNATNAAKTASTQVPKIVSNARHAATDKIPAPVRRRGGHRRRDRRRRAGRESHLSR